MTTPTGLNQTHCPILHSLCNRGQTITHIQSYTNQTTTHIQFYTNQTTTHIQSYIDQTTTHIQSYIGQLVPTRLHLWTCNAPEEEAQQLRWQPSIDDLNGFQYFLSRLGAIPSAPQVRLSARMVPLSCALWTDRSPTQKLSLPDFTNFTFSTNFQTILRTTIVRTTSLKCSHKWSTIFMQKGFFLNIFHFPKQWNR